MLSLRPGQKILDGSNSHHLSNSVEALAVEHEGLFEENLVLGGPLVWEGSEVCEV